MDGRAPTYSAIVEAPIKEVLAMTTTRDDATGAVQAIRPEPTPVEVPQEPPRLITGVAASPGRYTGTVRIIHSEAKFDQLRSGDVLVCAVAPPVWSVLFPRAGALVTDSGGILSNPAIIAREFGLPAVLATRIGTARLRDDQVVTVDGTTGTVEILG
jgi:phosphoenolpyruvate synthase/pyruvate phosphate dikinase